MRPIPPMAMSHTNLPSRELSSGATMTSPVGRFIHFIVFQSIFVSVKNGLPSTHKETFVPAGFVISILTAWLNFSISLSANACICRCSSVVNANAPSVSMSIVTPGQCPKRALRSLVSIFMSCILNGVSSRFPRRRLM